MYYPEMEEVARATLVQHGLSPLKVACVNHIVRDETGEGLGPHRVVVSHHLPVHYPHHAVTSDLWPDLSFICLRSSMYAPVPRSRCPHLLLVGVEFDLSSLDSKRTCTPPTS